MGDAVLVGERILQQLSGLQEAGSVGRVAGCETGPVGAESGYQTLALLKPC